MAKMTRAEVIKELHLWLMTYGPYTAEDDDGTRMDEFEELCEAAPADVAARARAAKAKRETEHEAERAADEAAERAKYVARVTRPTPRRRWTR